MRSPRSASVTKIKHTFHCILGLELTAFWRIHEATAQQKRSTERNTSKFCCIHKSIFFQVRELKTTLSKTVTEIILSEYSLAVKL